MCLGATNFLWSIQREILWPRHSREGGFSESLVTPQGVIVFVPPAVGIIRRYFTEISLYLAKQSRSYIDSFFPFSLLSAGKRSSDHFRVDQSRFAADGRVDGAIFPHPPHNPVDLVVVVVGTAPRRHQCLVESGLFFRLPGLRMEIFSTGLHH